MQAKLKHLEFIQRSIDRLASDSFRVKGWSVFLTAALAVLWTREERIEIAFIGLVPVLVFWGLDGWLLRQERLFRALYDRVRELDDHAVDFSMNTAALRTSRARTWLGAVFSKTLIVFYGALILTIVLAIAAGCRAG